MLSCFALYASAEKLQSPNGLLQAELTIRNEAFVYSLDYKRILVVKESRLGFELKDGNDLLDDFEIIDTHREMVGKTRTPIWGKTKTIRNFYKEMAVTLLQKKTNRKMTVRLRLFNDGLGFWYEFIHKKS